ESLPQYVAIDQKMQGTVQLALTAKGHLTDLKANLKLSGQQLTVDRYSNVNVDGEGDYDAGSSIVKLDALNVNSAIGTVRATGELGLDSNHGSKVILASRDLN